MSRLRVKVYAPHVPASPTPRFAVRVAHALADHADRTPDLEMSVTAAVADASGAPLPWPVARFTPLTAADLKADPYGLETYARLTAPDARAFDVLFLPHPWKHYPAGRLTPTAAPFVAYVPDLDFDDADLGSVTDACRLVMASIARDGAAVVFPSAGLRDRAVRRFGVPAGRTAVVPPARTVDAAPADAAATVQALGLPADYVLFLEAADGGAAAELHEGLRAAGVNWSVVAMEGPVPDDRWPQTATAASGAGPVRLSRLGEGEFAAVLACAKAVVADTASTTPFLAAPHLDALMLRKPLLCRSAGAAERWDGDRVGATLLFRTAGEAAAQLRRLHDDPQALGAHSDRGEWQVRSRSAEDQARELFQIFGEVHAAPATSRIRFRSEPVVSREKRILYLINHGAVHACEVGLLRSLGYEIYSPKQMPKTDYRSLSIVHADDDKSTLPRWVLERLNRHNFYEDPLPEDLVSLLNGYFGTAIISVWGTMFVEAVHKFRGRILARAFGREHPVTYFQYWDHFGGAALWDRIREIRHRFWLTAPYDSVGDWEPEPLRGCSLTLPLGIADRVWRNEGKWTGTQAKLFFVCPSINLTPQYYGKVYKDFKYHFGDLPHLIAGNQETPVPDPAVTGKVPEGAFRRLMNELRVMYYHSREPRHLHYHPLEAIVHGMPLVYLTGGLTDYFGGPDQPGACETEADARRKIRRILGGDWDLVNEIRSKQVKILETFTDQAVRGEWLEKFVGRVMATPVTPDTIPPTLWAEPARAEAARPLPGRTGPLGRVGVYAGGLPTPEAARHAVVFAGAVTPEAARTELLIGRRAAAGAGWTGRGGGKSRFRALRENEYLPGVSIPKSQVNVVAAPEGAGLSAASGDGRTRPKVKATLNRLQDIRVSHRSRLVRVGATLGVSAIYYARAVRDQGTLRTRGSKAVVVLKDTLKRYDHPGPAPLTFDQVRRIARRNDVTVFVHPADLLAADQPLDEVEELPAVVLVHDLAHEFSATGRGPGVARHREMRLWAKIARVLVFGSEHLRREAIRLYGIPAEKTAVVALPPLVPAEEPPSEERKRSVRTRLKLPKEFILTPADLDPNVNTLAVLEAACVLKWKSGEAPGVVLAGRGARLLVDEETDGPYAAKVRQVIREGGLVEGEDYFVLDRIDPEDLSALYAASAAYVSVAKFEAQLHGTVLRAMLAERPVVCSAVPANVEQLGGGDELALMVPPDDPAALADAVARILDGPEEARRRAERAAAWAKSLDAEQALEECRKAVAAAAAAKIPESPAAAARRSAA